MATFSFIYLFLKYFLAELGLGCCEGFSLVAVSWGYSLVVMGRLLIAVASLVADHGLWGSGASVVVAHELRSCGFQAPEHRLSSCGARVWLL